MNLNLKTPSPFVKNYSMSLMEVRDGFYAAQVTTEGGLPMAADTLKI